MARRNADTPSPQRQTLVIDAIGAEGDGLARGADGGAVYVPYAAPGDVVVADVTGERGAIVSIAKEGPDRTAPLCRHFGQCGGCALQHVTRSFEGEWKRARVAAALAREGVAADVAATTAIAHASRRRATFAFRREEGAFGFHARKSSRVVAIEECPVLDPAFAGRVAALGALAAALPGRAFDLAVTLCDNGLDVDAQGAGAIAGPALQRAAEAMRKAGAVRLSIDGAPAITLEPPLIVMGGVAVRPPPGGFLQASAAGEAALVARVSASLEGARRIVDLFCGAGAFALPLARSASLSAFDSDHAAIAALKAAAADAQRAGLAIHPLRAEARDLFERPLSAKELKSFDAAVIDPPRAGAKAQAEMLAQSAIRRVAYASCNPASFARDAAILVRGGLKLVSVEPVDQFAFSPHVELFAAFSR